MDGGRGWQILLVGGASGSGKSCLGQPLARALGVALTEVDDLQVALERLTTPEQFPELHFWATHPDPASLPAEEIMRQGLALARALAPALEAVLENRLEEGRPALLEGDFLLPGLAAADAYGGQANGGRVRGLFLREPSQAQLEANFARREPAAGTQPLRARVSSLWDAWFAAECERLGVPTLPARPWATVLERALQTLD